MADVDNFAVLQYYSAVSWVDFLIGIMLTELDTLGHTEDTVVALVGDHGSCLDLLSRCVKSVTQSCVCRLATRRVSYLSGNCWGVY